MAPRIPPLPFRPLQVMGHGVYDPVKQTFYPFRVSEITVIGLQGMHNYVRSTSITNPDGMNSWGMTVDRGVWAAVGAFQAMDVLTDAETDLTLTAMVGGGTIVYATIPADSAGDLR